MRTNLKYSQRQKENKKDFHLDKPLCLDCAGALYHQYESQAGMWPVKCSFCGVEVVNSAIWYRLPKNI